MARKSIKHRYQLGEFFHFGRLGILGIGIFLFGFLIIWKLFSIQVLLHEKYQTLASSQYDFYRRLHPERGKIFFTQEKNPENFFPVAGNREYVLVYANPYLISDVPKTVLELINIFPELEAEKENLLLRLSKSEDPYEPILHKVSWEKQELLKQKNLTGIGFSEESFRYYPENNIGSHLLGFVSFDGKIQKGQYGVEGFFQEELAGKDGYLEAERDAQGSIIGVSDVSYKEAENGADIYLTIDHTLEYYACSELNKTVAKYKAKGGSVIIMDPKTGKILVMCGSPDFNPNFYEEATQLENFNNPAIFNAYEPGSVFKPITMASAIDQGKVTPETVFEDTGSRQFDRYIIRNADDKVYGKATMTEVLENSINTGAIFVAESIGVDTFLEYMKKFGFDDRVGIELPGEANSNLSTLDTHRPINLATASFGQGITVTPLQLLAAYGAIANGGKFMKPFIVAKIMYPHKETIEAHPKEIRQALSQRSANLISGMLVQVVEKGHSKRAKISGYYIAGKTGTAQIPDPKTGGYSDQTIHTFVGFGPVEDPRFVMLVRMDQPQGVRFAEGSVVPLFRQIADFLLKYLEIEPSYTP